MKKTRSLFGTNDSDFDRFWAAYPRHVGKVAARRVWNQLRPPADLVDRILVALEWQRALPQWQDEDFVPHPRTYLYNARWEDEPPKGVRIPLTPWREQCRELQHDPECGSSDAHKLRILVKANGCQHLGVCRSHGEHTQRVADERKAVAS
jgi:hypothetical protein